MLRCPIWIVENAQYAKHADSGNVSVVGGVMLGADNAMVVLNHVGGGGHQNQHHHPHVGGGVDVAAGVMLCL